MGLFPTWSLYLPVLSNSASKTQNFRSLEGFFWKSSHEKEERTSSCPLFSSSLSLSQFYELNIARYTHWMGRCVGSPHQMSNRSIFTSLSKHICQDIAWKQPAEPDEYKILIKAFYSYTATPPHEWQKATVLSDPGKLKARTKVLTFTAIHRREWSLQDNVWQTEGQTQTGLVNVISHIYWMQCYQSIRLLLGETRREISCIRFNTKPNLNWNLLHFLSALFSNLFFHLFYSSVILLES